MDQVQSCAQQQVQDFRLSGVAQAEEDERKVADIERQGQADRVSRITNDADLFRAAISGDITGLSNSDRNFWQAHLRNVTNEKNPQGDPSAFFVNNPGDRSFIGAKGGFNSSNEQKLARLLTQYQAQRAV